MKGELRVLDGLPEPLAHGAFGKARTYQLILRFSTNPGDILDDSVSAPRGLAMKLIGVERVRLPGSENAATQDIVLINAPCFTAATPKKFCCELKALAKTTDTPQGVKKVLLAVLCGAEASLQAFGGGESGTLRGLGGHPRTTPLAETYYSVVPFLHGSHIAKLNAAPILPAFTALTNQSVDLDGHPYGLREALTVFFADQAGEWEVRLQLCTDLAKIPIEDAAVRWPEGDSPCLAVARITVPAQPPWSETRSSEVDDGLSFSPWHGLAAHRPLSGIMRSCKPAYEMSAGFQASIMAARSTSRIARCHPQLSARSRVAWPGWRPGSCCRQCGLAWRRRPGRRLKWCG